VGDRDQARCTEGMHGLQYTPLEATGHLAVAPIGERSSRELTVFWHAGLDEEQLRPPVGRTGRACATAVGRPQ
jgi:hypothetical protein